MPYDHSAVTSAELIRILTTTRTPLVGPATIWGWIILFSVVVSSSADSVHQHADQAQPLGLIGQYTITYAGQRVSGTQVSIAMYFGVSPNSQVAIVR